MYVDVHTHLIHPEFQGEEDATAQRALDAGLECVIVNGLEPRSNREVLSLCARHPHLYPALGIYPVDAIANEIAQEGWDHDWPPPAPFDVDKEIAFIAAQAPSLIAIGEIGLDQYWVRDQAIPQERVFRKLVQVALDHDRPIIIHTRRAEARAFEIIQEMGVERCNFHCYGGKLKLAQRIAAAGYYLSIPPVVERAESFQRLVANLPLDRLLSETDAPYMGPDRGERNEPANIPRGIAAMAAIRELPVVEMRATVRENFRRLFRV